MIKRIFFLVLLTKLTLIKMSILNLKSIKPKAGLLLIASPRFEKIGEGLPEGTYDTRKRATVTNIVASLEKDITLVNPGIIYTRDDLQKATDAFLFEKVDFVIAEFLSWSEDFAWVRFLRDLKEMPVIFVNTVKDKVCFNTTVEENDFVEFLSAGTLVGTLEAAGSVKRIERDNVMTVIGNRDEVTKQIICFSRAAKVRSVLRKSTFGLLSGFNELMWSTYIDPYNFFVRIGPEIRFLSYSTYAAEIEKISDEETSNYLNELKHLYKVDEGIDEDKFYASVRASLAIARLTVKEGIDAMVFNDVDPAMFNIIGLRPGFYHPSLNENISVLVPEADMGAATITYILKLLSGKSVNFIEPFHIEKEFNTFAGGHAGPNDHTDPVNYSNVVISKDVRFAKTSYKYAGAPFAWNRISAGEKTMAQLVECNGKFKLVCSLVESLEGEHLFASYSHSIFRPKGDVTRFFEQILAVGTTQHFGIVDGDYRRELNMLSRIMGLDYTEIA